MTCSRCKKHKPTHHFWKQSQQGGRLTKMCAECRRKNRQRMAATHKKITKPKIPVNPVTVRKMTREERIRMMI